MHKANGTLSGLLWKLLERFGVSATQFILQVVLARMLTPEHYGVLSLMMIFIALANVFIQQGFNTALIQNKDVTEEDYSSVLWVSLGIAGILYVIIFAASPLIGAYYSMPDIVLPMRVLALMLFPGALNSVQLAKVSRAMDFKKVFFSNIGGVVFSGALGILIAFLGGGLWALVAQTLLNVLVACLVMFFSAKLQISFSINWARVKVLFSYGWKLLVSSLLDTLFQDLRSLVIGKKYDSSTLGYYNRGKQFPQFMINAVNGAVQSVMLPAMSTKQDHPDRVKTLMRHSIALSAYIIFPLMAGLAAAAKPVVTLLLTEKWLPCVPYMWIYCFTFAFYPIHTCNLQAINAMGRSDIFLKLELIKKAYALVVLVIAVVCFDSPLAIAGTGVVTTWISWFVNAYPNKKLINYTYKEQFFDIVPSFALTLVMCGAVLLIGQLSLAPAVLIVLEVVTGVVVYAALSLIFKPQPYRMTLDMLKGYLRH